MSYGVDAPNGLVPMNYADGSPWNGQTTMWTIDPSAGSIGTNDPVIVTSTGTIAKAPSYSTLPSAQTDFIGVFQGCRYTLASPVGLTSIVNSKIWPAGTQIAEGSTIYAYVVSDPAVQFNVQVDSGTIPNGAVQSNMYLVAGTNGATPNPVTGMSQVALSLISPSGTANNQFAPFIITGLVNNNDNKWGIPNNNVIVQINSSLLKAGTVGR